MNVDEEAREVGPGDVVYLPRFSTHCVVNDSDRPVSFLCVWWGAPKADAATS
jgi:oxalate decarboxylase/phosphoglucose isomerase-like protein (cupin superfamily)